MSLCHPVHVYACCPCVLVRQPPQSATNIYQALSLVGLMNVDPGANYADTESSLGGGAIFQGAIMFSSTKPSNHCLTIASQSLP